MEYLAAAGLVVYVAGDSAWIPIIVAGALALLAYGFFGELNGMFPTAAAIRLYMKRAMDDRIALTITFTYLTTIVLVIASDAFIVGSALAHAFGEPAWVASIWIVGLLAIAVVTNLRGITVAGLLQDVATSIVIAATLAIGVLALVRSGHGLHTPFQPLHGHHPGDLLQAVALGVFLYSAFEWVTTSAEEVRKPSSINRGMLIAIGILCVVCAVATVAMSHTLSHHELTSAYPQLYLGVAALGHSGLWVMAAVTAVTALNTFNGGFITASRFIYGTAREGSLPPQLAQLNRRAVPWVPVVVLGALSAVVALLVALTHAWEVLVAVGAALEGMIYAVAGLLRAASAHPRARPAPPLPGARAGRPRAARHRPVRRAGRPGVGLGAGHVQPRPARDHSGGRRARARSTCCECSRASPSARQRAGPPVPAAARPAPGTPSARGGCAATVAGRGERAPASPVPAPPPGRKRPRPPTAWGTWRSG